MNYLAFWLFMSGFCIGSAITAIFCFIEPLDFIQTIFIPLFLTLVGLIYFKVYLSENKEALGK